MISQDAYQVLFHVYSILLSMEVLHPRNLEMCRSCTHKVNRPKKFDKDLCPISLTPVISKVQEWFLHEWMWDVIQHIVDNFQFRAIKGTCTTHALIIMVHDWLKAIDRSSAKGFIQIVMFDYAKALIILILTFSLKLESINIPDGLLKGC